MVEHPEWIDDQRLYAYAGRALRRPELEAAIREWVEKRTAAEVLEMADLLRVPAAPMGNGQRITGLDHFVERNFYLPHPRSGLLQPDVSYTLGGSAERRYPTASPALGCARPRRGGAPGHPRALSGHASVTPERLPLEGVRVADFTAFWAGPIVGHFLAMMGADVIHVESVKRPDGIRGHTVVTTSDDLWWEWTPQFHGPNTNKRDITLDMATDDGRRLARRLIAECDVMLENYAPRVMDQWGLGWEEVRAAAARSDLRPHAGIRAERSVAKPHWLRAEHGTGLRHGVDDRIPRRPAARAERDLRSPGRYPCHVGAPSRPRTPAQDRRGHVGRGPDGGGRGQRGGRAGTRVPGLRPSHAA